MEAEDVTGRVEWLRPPELDLAKLLESARYHSAAMYGATLTHEWERAARHGEIAMNLMRIAAIHEDRTANPIRVEYPD